MDAMAGQKIYARRMEGFTLKAIGLKFGLSPARVREIAMGLARKAKWREYAIGLDGINNEGPPVDVGRSGSSPSGGTLCCCLAVWSEWGIATRAPSTSC
jgi:hypothetical protein